MRVILLLFCFALLPSNSIWSQNSLGSSDDFGRIALNSYIPNEVLADMPRARKLLESKLKAIASMNGMGGNEALPRFIITGDATTIFSETLDGLPPKYAKTVQVVLSIGDGLAGVQFSSEVFELKGIDDREDQAFVSAINKLSPRNKTIAEFVEQAKTKIIEYYNSKCDFIIKEAETLSANKSYDDALATLIEIPQVCKDCYDKAMDLAQTVYKSKVENECQLQISEANALIAQDQWDDAASALFGVTPDMACYTDVAGIMKKITDHRCSISIGKAKAAWAQRDAQLASQALSEVPSDSECYTEAKGLFAQIGNQIDALEKREWDLAYEQYNREQSIREATSDLEMEIARSSHANALLNSEIQRKVSMLNAESQAYLTKKTADTRAMYTEYMVNTAQKAAEERARASQPAYKKIMNYFNL